jgi:hypothetical protein
MTNILSAAEGANFVRTDTTDAVMLMLLPQIDEIIKRATGRDWTADTPINPVAKAAAGMLLVQYYDNLSQMGTGMGTDGVLAYGVTNALGQLEAEALKYRKYQFYGLSNAGYIAIDGARIGDDVISVTGIYGVTGSQVSKFESQISSCDALKQTSSDNLSSNIYVVILKSPADDVSA